MKKKQVGLLFFDHLWSIDYLTALGWHSKQLLSDQMIVHLLGVLTPQHRKYLPSIAALLKESKSSSLGSGERGHCICNQNVEGSSVHSPQAGLENNFGWLIITVQQSISFVLISCDPLSSRLGARTRLGHLWPAQSVIRTKGIPTNISHVCCK